MPTKRDADAEARRKEAQLAPIPVRDLPAGEVDLPKRIIAKVIRDRAQQGIFRPGERAPSINDIMQMSGTAKNTARAAMEMLREANMIKTMTGFGSFFTPENQWQDLPGE
jgi:DNA-binding FadR family transcriptional regulator